MSRVPPLEAQAETSTASPDPTKALRRKLSMGPFVVRRI